MRLVLLGPPGAGKGTLANLLRDHLKIQHISTGDILREEMKKESPLGKKTKTIVDRGALVPDDIVTKIIENKFSEDNLIHQGFLLDGFPRTKLQAEDLDKILNPLHKPLDCALYLDASRKIIIQRLTGRRVCRHCGAVYHIHNRLPKIEGKCDVCNGHLYQRPDDNEETIKTRLDVYIKSTAPIIEYYAQQKKLLKVDGDRDSEKVFEQFMKRINETQRSH